MAVPSLLNEKGVTIAELLVAILLSSIAAGILFLNHIFFNATTVEWRQSLAAEIDIERMVNAVDHELRNLTALDTLLPDRMKYRNKAGRAQNMILGPETLVVPGAAAPALRRVRLDSAFFRVLPDTALPGRERDPALAWAALDRNHDNVLCGAELFPVDFLLCNMNFSFGRKFEKRFSVEIRDRLLNRPLPLKEF